MPNSVAVATSMLSVPTPNLPIATHFSADRITFSVTFAKQVIIASTSFAKLIRVSSSPSGATITSAPAASNTALSGSVVGQTWSVISTFQPILFLPMVMN